MADYNNSRVLEYNNPLGSNPPNVTPDLVFGQDSSGTDQRYLAHHERRFSPCYQTRTVHARNPLDRVNRAMTVARELKPDELGSHVGNDAVDADSVLSPTDIETLLGVARPGFERTLVETAYLTGAREDELLALRWTDLELPKEGPVKWPYAAIFRGPLRKVKRAARVIFRPRQKPSGERFRSPHRWSLI
jgi:integrase